MLHATILVAVETAGKWSRCPTVPPLISALLFSCTVCMYCVVLDCVPVCSPSQILWKWSGPLEGWSAVGVGALARGGSGSRDELFGDEGDECILCARTHQDNSASAARSSDSGWPEFGMRKRAMCHGIPAHRDSMFLALDWTAFNTQVPAAERGPGDGDRDQSMPFSPKAVTLTLIASIKGPRCWLCADVAACGWIRKYARKRYIR